MAREARRTEWEPTRAAAASPHPATSTARAPSARTYRTCGAGAASVAAGNPLLGNTSPARAGGPHAHDMRRVSGGYGAVPRGVQMIPCALGRGAPHPAPWRPRSSRSHARARALWSWLPREVGRGGREQDGCFHARARWP
eukprot:scaffold6181_cov242-Prasinococcus_capsulatus_cf.AAC.1